MKSQRKETITSTDFARNMASTIDHVRISGNVVEITKGNQTIARLTPPRQKGFPIAQLGQFLQELPHLGKENGHHMTSALKNIRDNAILPDSSWD